MLYGKEKDLYDKLVADRDALLAALTDLLSPGAWRHDSDCRSEKEGFDACDCGYRLRIETGRLAKEQAEKVGGTT